MQFLTTTSDKTQHNTEHFLPWPFSRHHRSPFRSMPVLQHVRSRRPWSPHVLRECGPWTRRHRKGEPRRAGSTALRGDFPSCFKDTTCWEGADEPLLVLEKFFCFVLKRRYLYDSLTNVDTGCNLSPLVHMNQR